MATNKSGQVGAWTGEKLGLGFGGDIPVVATIEEGLAGNRPPSSSGSPPPAANCRTNGGPGSPRHSSQGVI